MIRCFFVWAVCAVALGASQMECLGAERPNIVFVLSEDNSTHYLRLYGEPLGATPAIEALAAEGVVFDNAYSCAPVCSVARTTLMTGIYAPKGGFQFHRAMAKATLPAGTPMWPRLLREAGYHTTNRSKKDYNVVEGDGVWDASSRNATWRDRPDEETPFFHMRTLTTSHESSLHFDAESMRTHPTDVDPDAVTLAPYHPDTSTFRYTRARYLDRIRDVDERIGSLVAALEADGVLEDTYIFYFGDHGGVLPRGKGYAYESGLHVPLVVRIPENFRAESGFDVGSRTSGVVEFVDLGPTALSLAGISAPEVLDGRPIFGARRESLRREAFGYADRFDEKYDLVRTLRIGKWKYMRHYTGHYPDGLQNNYRYRMLAYEQWRTMFRRGALNPVQAAFFQARPPETLYDLSVDPHETVNLAQDPEHRSQLLLMRERLRHRMKSLPDLSLYPESYLATEAMDDPVAFGRTRAAHIAELLDTADLALLPLEQARPLLRRALGSEDLWRRHWALTALCAFGSRAHDLEDWVAEAFEDPEPLNRMRAAEFWMLLGYADAAPQMYRAVNGARSRVEALILWNGAIFMRDHAPGIPFDPRQIENRGWGGEVDRRWDYVLGNARP